VNRSGRIPSRRRSISGISVSIVVFELGTINPTRNGFVTTLLPSSRQRRHAEQGYRGGGRVVRGPYTPSTVRSDLGIDALTGRLRTLAARTLEPGEDVLFCLTGSAGQALVALERRLVILKASAASGSPFGGRMASYRYEEIADVSLEIGEVNSAIKIVTVRRPEGREWWQWRVAAEDPLRSLGCLLVQSSLVPDYAPYVERLRSLVAEARKEKRQGPGEEPAVAAPSAAALVAELERLALLHASHELSDEEFARATRALLASRG
jgi:hypothetical protein